MTLNIGENIKKLRKQKGITQEQFAEVLGVSNVAVSKWECGETYPDISLLPVIAKHFSVSIDVLMGYNKEETDEVIDGIVAEYKSCCAVGQFKRAELIVTDARNKYNSDYRIMNIYLHHLSGGKNIFKDKLIKNKDEIIKLCEMIIDGSSDENIRHEAINTKAKVLHVTSNTDKALELLKAFPGYSATREEKSELLFEYGTTESQYWVKRNLYALANRFSIKSVNHYWYANESDKPKEYAIEKIADSVYNIYTALNDTFFLIMACGMYESLARKITAHWGNTEDIIRIREKQLICSSEIDSLLETNDVLKEGICSTYNQSKLTPWIINHLKTAEAKTFEKLRRIPEFIMLLEKYSDK